MIRRLLARLLPGRSARKPRVYAASQHPVRAQQLSHAARTVIRNLQEAGFKAYVVGGAVRDLLLGIEPKDFDVATDATPEQVKPLFRRAFVIGRPIASPVYRNSVHRARRARAVLVASAADVIGRAL